jgi:hypothetical protein
MWRDAFQYPMVLHGTMTLLLALAVVRGGPMAGSRAMLA